MKGQIFDIQGFSVHDGPGCRTVVFMKGCPLACFWCANPEGIDVRPQPMVTLERCDSCGRCVTACPSNSIEILADEVAFDRNACGSCHDHRCVPSCWSGAVSVAGRDATVAELMRVFQRDRHFWGTEGGVTITGGEPLFQRKFVGEVLLQCADHYIDTAIETCGQVAWAVYEECLPSVDFVFFDLKHMDSDYHRAGTGRGNRLILDNARRLAAHFPGRLVFRMPLVPDFNASPDHLDKLAGFLSSLPRENLEINILPIHHMARQKYRKLGRAYGMPGLEHCVDSDIAAAREAFESRGIACYVGSETPF